MFEFLQTFNRVALAFLSGALLLVGTTFLADLGMGRCGVIAHDEAVCNAPSNTVANPTGHAKREGAFDEISKMLNNTPLKLIFAVIMTLTAYVIGIINFAASCVAFRWLVKTNRDEILLVSQIESLQQPQVLKEFLELLHVKRTLLAFAFPLFYFGVALALDRYEWTFSDWVRGVAGGVLALLAVLGCVFAVLMTGLLEATAKKLLADARTKTLNPAN